MRPKTHALLAVFALAACSSPGSRAEPAHVTPLAGMGGSVAGTGGAAGDGAGMGALIGGTGALDDGMYRVRVQANDTALCEGECTTLYADVLNGTPPIQYIWNDASLSGAGPFEVCPSETTTYQLRARDSFSSLEEFGAADHEAQGALEIRVTERCDDEPAPPIDISELEPGTEICELRIPYSVEVSVSPFSTWGGQTIIHTDDDGNMYFGATYSGAPRIGDLEIEPAASAQGVLVKVSPSCEPIWAKVLPHQSEGSLVLTGLAVSADGEQIYVGVDLDGVATFAGETFDASGFEAGLLLKLDGDAEVIWAKRTTGSNLSAIDDVSITSDGDVVVTGFGPGDMTFAGRTMDLPTPDLLAFVARVRGDGNATFLHSVPFVIETLSAVVTPDDSVGLMGWGVISTPLQFAGGVIPHDPNAIRSVFVAMLEPQGDFRWGTLLATNDTGLGQFVGTMLTSDRDGNVIADESHYVQDENGTEVSTEPVMTKLSPSGELLWSKSRPFARNSELFWTGGMATDREGKIIVLDQAIDGAPIEGGGTFATSGRSDFVVNKRTADGAPIWLWQGGGSRVDWCWGIATDVENAIWVGSGQPIGEDLSSGEIVLTRLAP